MYLKVKLIAMLFPAILANALEPNYTLPTITYTTLEQERQQACQRGRDLMTLKDIPDGDVAIVCTNWTCPTSIVINAVRYGIVTNWWNDRIEFDVVTTNMPPTDIATGEIAIESDAKKARESLFAELSCTSMALQLYANSISYMPVDSATNMIFVTHINSAPNGRRWMIYKNIYIQYNAFIGSVDNPATNALAFLSAIINEGLPETERIALPQSQ